MRQYNVTLDAYPVQRITVENFIWFKKGLVCITVLLFLTAAYVLRTSSCLMHIFFCRF